MGTGKMMIWTGKFLLCMRFNHVFFVAGCIFWDKTTTCSTILVKLFFEMIRFKNYKFTVRKNKRIGEHLE